MCVRACLLRVFFLSFHFCSFCLCAVVVLCVHVHLIVPSADRSVERVWWCFHFFRCFSLNIMKTVLMLANYRTYDVMRWMNTDHWHGIVLAICCLPSQFDDRLAMSHIWLNGPLILLCAARSYCEFRFIEAIKSKLWHERWIHLVCNAGSTSQGEPLYGPQIEKNKFQHRPKNPINQRASNMRSSS